jgi:phosphatidate cytidylyltransferase
MCPRLSPGKSWEGTAGGYAFSLATAAIVVACAHLFKDVSFLSFVRTCTADLPLMIWFFISIAILVTVGICGDLLESLFKRQCGVKDSSALFPAMGGFFDTFDSIIFIPATMLFLIEVARMIF